MAHTRTNEHKTQVRQKRKQKTTQEYASSRNVSGRLSSFFRGSSPMSASVGSDVTVDGPYSSPSNLVGSAPPQSQSPGAPPPLTPPRLGSSKNPLPPLHRWAMLVRSYVAILSRMTWLLRAEERHVGPSLTWGCTRTNYVACTLQSKCMHCNGRLITNQHGHAHAVIVAWCNSMSGLLNINGCFLYCEKQHQCLRSMNSVAKASRWLIVAVSHAPRSGRSTCTLGHFGPCGLGGVRRKP